MNEIRPVHAFRAEPASPYAPLSEDLQADRPVEQRRLEALSRYDILDTPPSPAFDRITRLAARTLGVPITTLSFLDGHRQWHKSKVGLADAEVPRTTSLCNVTIEGEHPLVVPDALADPRFAGNAWVLGEPRIRFYAGVPLRTRDGLNIGTLCAIDTRPRDLEPGVIETLRDLADVVMHQLELMRLANHDDLTGALSRVAFREEANRALDLARRHKYPLGCLALDLDHFKRVNDTHGHAAGDAVLRDAIALCRKQMRSSDIIGRIGGEEFAIVLPHAGKRQARDIGERIRAAIENHEFVVPGATIRITASIGVAILESASEPIESLVARADVALYRAKAAGRNCCDDGPTREKRGAVRHRVLKGARIVFNGRRSTVDCTIRNLSEQGAGLEVTSAVGIPQSFDLEIPADGVVRRCRVAWRTERKLGVSFAEPAK